MPPGSSYEEIHDLNTKIDPQEQEILDSLRLIQIGESQGRNGKDARKAGIKRLRNVVLTVLDRPDSRNEKAYWKSIEYLSYIHMALPKDKEVKRVYESYQAEGKTTY